MTDGRDLYPQSSQGTDVEHPALNPANLEDENLGLPHPDQQWGNVKARLDAEEAGDGSVNTPPRAPNDFTPQPMPERERKGISRRSLLAGIIGGVVIVSGGAFATYKAVKPDATPKPHPTATGPAVPGKSSSPEASSSPSAETSLSPEEQRIKELELPLDATNEQLATDMWQQGRLTEWENAGATPALAREWQKISAPDADTKLLKPLAEQNAKTFAAALFPADWQKNPRLVNFVAGMQKRNYFTLQLYVRCSGGYKSNFDYKTWETADESSVAITHQDTDVATIVTQVTQHDNSDQNRAQYYAQGKLDVDGQTYSAKMSIKRETDRTVITDILLS